jgi:hypothetical protein
MCCFRSVVSIGSHAFSNSASLKEVLILSKEVDIDSKAFFMDTFLTRIYATAEICTQVRNSCDGTCFLFKTCSNVTAFPFPTPTPTPTTTTSYRISHVSDSDDANAAIGISAVVGAIVFISMLVFSIWFCCCKSRTPYVGYDAVHSIEMHPLSSARRSSNDLSIEEAQAVPRDGDGGEELSPYPVVAEVVSTQIRNSEESAAVAAVYCRDVVGIEPCHLIVNEGV